MENTTQPSAGKDESKIIIQEVLKPYLLKWYWFIISTFIALFLGFLFIEFSTPIYNVKSTVLIKDAKSSGAAGGDM